MLDEIYRDGLQNVIGITTHNKMEVVKNNYSYFPIFVDEKYKLTRDQLYFKLKENGINGRRYFYPLITQLTLFEEKSEINKFDLSNAEEVTQKVICLPISSDIDEKTAREIIELIKSF